jgi:hypothetical protein
MECRDINTRVRYNNREILRIVLIMYALPPVWLLFLRRGMEEADPILENATVSALSLSPSHLASPARKLCGWRP